jgi:hypothetical protein
VFDMSSPHDGGETSGAINPGTPQTAHHILKTVGGRRGTCAHLPWNRAAKSLHPLPEAQVSAEGLAN